MSETREESTPAYRPDSMETQSSDPEVNTDPSGTGGGYPIDPDDPPGKDPSES